ncbi:hypothetical protein HS088_TW16G00344 [Tripterygium wilfordii]|uniref:Uncharacterized protein n=1 Tax=Tripterygium wilfordii TaxID=458696 RepID=A0A7J7CIK5_TRIWF|nr:hypothetical protein HS088_TW16G00344 [Tripterygium wilfordii]
MLQQPILCFPSTTQENTHFFKTLQLFLGIFSWLSLKMKTSTTTLLMIILVISVAILSHVGVVQAARVLAESEDVFANANHLETYPSVYDKAKTTMACWLQRLASGPSPKGPGH